MRMAYGSCVVKTAFSPRMFLLCDKLIFWQKEHQNDLTPGHCCWFCAERMGRGRQAMYLMDTHSKSGLQGCTPTKDLSCPSLLLFYLLLMLSFVYFYFAMLCDRLMPAPHTCSYQCHQW